MSGSLVLVDDFTISSGVTSVIIGGGSSGSSSYNFTIDTTYEVYLLQISEINCSADEAPFMRVTKSGSAQSDSNYDEAKKYLKSDTTFANGAQENVTKIDCMATIDSSVTAGGGYGTFYLFNFPNAEYSFVTVESTHLQASDVAARGFRGGFVHTVASASDGIQISANNYSSGSTLTSGNFKLFGIKK
tara:strand:- start:453 stop:1016 length:564 start_codon:yes stop_codon:yes gene_type:complete